MGSLHLLQQKDCHCNDQPSPLPQIWICSNKLKSKILNNLGFRFPICIHLFYEIDVISLLLFSPEFASA